MELIVGLLYFILLICFALGFVMVVMHMIKYRSIETYLKKNHTDTWSTYGKPDFMFNQSEKIDKKFFNVIRCGELKKLEDEKLNLMIDDLLWSYGIGKVSCILVFICYFSILFLSGK